jgi:hypothetical protein
MWLPTSTGGGGGAGRRPGTRRRSWVRRSFTACPRVGACRLHSGSPGARARRCAGVLTHPQPPRPWALGAARPGPPRGPPDGG